MKLYFLSSSFHAIMFLSRLKRMILDHKGIRKILRVNEKGEKYKANKCHHTSTKNSCVAFFQGYSSYSCVYPKIYPKDILH